jgi:hypothetical protein
MPIRALVAVLLLLAGVPGSTVDAAPSLVRVLDLDGRPIDPFDIAAKAKATALAFVFISVECPISNRYAPEIRRLHDAFTARGVHFWLVFPDPADSPAIIRRHLQEFDYPVRALRDAEHELVTRAGATITPEAAVYDSRGQLAYRGRIDDRYIRLGLERPKASRKDLEAALSATLAGAPVSEPTTSAVGCYIADFAHIH